jgi:hypothetical protein
MFEHPYIIEKLVELDKQRVSRYLPHELPPAPRRANGFARSIGRAMRRAGERLETWAGPGTPQSDYLPEARRY